MVLLSRRITPVLLIALLCAIGGCASSRRGGFGGPSHPAAYFFGAALADMEAEDGQFVLYAPGATAATLDPETFLPTLPVDLSADDPWATAFVRGHNDRVRHHQRHMPTSRPVPPDVV